MKFLREARLTDFYERSTLEIAAKAIWSHMREFCAEHGSDFESFKYRNYVGDYTFGFSRVISILHTVKPAKQFLGKPFAEEFWHIIWAAEFDDWEVDHNIRGTMRQFSQRLAAINQAYNDGHQDGVSYFAGLPFDGKNVNGSMFFGESFNCLAHTIRRKAKEDGS